jgi:hypothetical protein
MASAIERLAATSITSGERRSAWRRRRRRKAAAGTHVVQRRPRNRRGKGLAGDHGDKAWPGNHAVTGEGAGVVMGPRVAWHVPGNIRAPGQGLRTVARTDHDGCAGRSPVHHEAGGHDQIQRKGQERQKHPGSR